MIRRLKKLLALALLPIVVTILVVPMLGGRTSASEVVESHNAVEAQGEHAAAEVGEHDTPATATEEHQGEEAAHDNEKHATEHGAAEHAPEPWWRFTGWEAAYAALSSALFLITLRWLPLILEDKTGEGIK